MCFAIDHRNRRAPKSLARDQPITIAIIDIPFSNAFLLQPFNHRLNGGILHAFVVGRARSVEGSAIDHHAFVFMRGFHCVAVQLLQGRTAV